MEHLIYLAIPFIVIFALAVFVLAVLGVVCLFALVYVIMRELKHSFQHKNVG